MKRPPEMSRAQFAAALKRRGFRQVLMWFEDTTGQVRGTSWGAVLHMNGKMARRATLAKIIRERDAEIARNENSIKSVGFSNPDAATIKNGEIV